MFFGTFVIRAQGARTKENEMYELKQQGSRYKGYTPATEIAKLIRSEIVDAKKNNALPKELKVSVRSHSFAGGQAIDVTLSGLPKDEVWVFDEFHKCDVYTEQAKAIQNFIEEIRNDWNIDRSESQVDYFDVMYYGRTEWDWRTKK